MFAGVGRQLLMEESPNPYSHPHLDPQEGLILAVVGQ
jgi:hypothetical protein